jgi:hypothetical protein
MNGYRRRFQERVEEDRAGQMLFSNGSSSEVEHQLLRLRPDRVRSFRACRCTAADSRFVVQLTARTLVQRFGFASVS